MSAPAGTPGRLFSGASTGGDLVPGVPRRVLDLAEQLEAMARGLAAADRLLQGTAMGGWQGSAAKACAHLLASMPQPYAEAARALGAAVAPVRAHAGVLAVAQQDADEAVTLDLRAAAAHAAAMSPAAAAAGTSTGADPSAVAAAAMQRRALDLVAHARLRVRASASEAAKALRAAASAAPERPASLRRLLQAVIEVQRELQVGAVESVVATVTAVARYSPNRLFVDADGWERDLAVLAGGVDQMRRHPVRAAASIADLQLLRDNPGRWVGHLAPDAALGVATGGTALVASRGASLGVRAASLVTPGARGAEIRAAVSASAATYRSRLRARDLRSYASAPNDFGHVSRLSASERLLTSALARDARWAEAHTTARVLRAGERVGALPVGLPNAVKGTDSLYRKVSAQVGDHPGGAAGVVAEVNDSVRYTFVFPKDQYVLAAGATIRALRAEQLLLVKPKSFWGGSRYQGLNMTYADPRTGRLLEVQLHTPESWQATIETHPDFEVFRQIGIPADLKADYAERIGAVYARVPPPTGLDSLDGVLAAHPRVADPGNTAPQLLSVHPLAVPAATGAAAMTSLSSGHDDRGQRELEHGHPRHERRGEP